MTIVSFYFSLFRSLDYCLLSVLFVDVFLLCLWFLCVSSCLCIIHDNHYCCDLEWQDLFISINRGENKGWWIVLIFWYLSSLPLYPLGTIRIQFQPTWQQQKRWLRSMRIGSWHVKTHCPPSPTQCMRNSKEGRRKRSRRGRRESEGRRRSGIKRRKRGGQKWRMRNRSRRRLRRMWFLWKMTHLHPWPKRERLCCFLQSFFSWYHKVI